MLQDEHYMQVCLKLAAQAQGRTSPNPLVGAVVVDAQGNILGQGFHEKAGQAHAEVNALNEAGAAARGQTLYINLEPCCHHGKTPPCTDKVIASGVRTVVCGMLDPNPKVAGGGIRAIEHAGIAVRSGILEAECRYLNRAFIKWITRGRPWVSLKMASTLDGRIADRHGHSRWISGAAARELVHEMRDTHDCVMIGGATAQLDDPELTVRGRPGSRNPWRAILDTDLVLTADMRLFKNEDQAKTILFARQEAVDNNQKSYLPDTRVVSVAASNGHLSLPAIMDWLAENQILSVLCEGGSHLAASLLEEQLVDELFWIIAPKLLCDRQSTPSLSGRTYVPLDQAVSFKTKNVRQLDDDVLIHGLLNEP